jgi:hypothetical protein
MPRTIEVTTNVTGYRPNRTDQRWGGVLHSYAQGGIEPAHVARGTMIRYAEPETGGEAFIPRLGNPARSRAVLTEAASWYGFGLVPMATGGITAYGGVSGNRGGGGGGPVYLQPIIQVSVTEDVSPMGLAKIERAAKRAATDAVSEAFSRSVGGRL